MVLGSKELEIFFSVIESVAVNVMDVESVRSMKNDSVKVDNTDFILSLDTTTDVFFPLTSPGEPLPLAEP